MVIQQCWLYCSKCYYRASGRGKETFDYVKSAGVMPDTDAYELDQPIPNLAFGYTNMGENFQLLLGSQRRNHLCMILVEILQ